MLTSFVPGASFVPTAANFFAPCRAIQATCASVSPFWTTVGAPRSPRSVGYGRPDDRHAAVAGQRGQQGGLLAGDQGAGAPPGPMTTHEKSVPITR